MSSESPRCIITKGAVWGWTLLTLPLQHEQYMEIIHPPPTVSLAPRCRAPLWPASSVYHTHFFFSFSQHMDLHTHTHTLTMWQTVKTQAPSISSPPIHFSVLHPFPPSLPFIHKQTGTVSFSVFSSVHHWIIPLHLSAPFRRTCCVWST